MRLFEEPSQQRRIAAYASYEFPIDSDREAYAWLDRLAAALDGTPRFVHSVVADPRQEAVALRSRIGLGLFVPYDPAIHCNDVEHLRATMPAEFGAVATSLAGVMGESVPRTIAQPEFQAAMSGTRWLRAWQPDLIACFGLQPFSLHAVVASTMLAIPRLVVLDALPENPALLALLPVYLGQADWVVVATQELADVVAAKAGAGVAEKVFVAGDSLPEDLLAGIRGRIDGARASRPHLGPERALRTRSEVQRGEGEATPLLLLGAERTGSTMMANLLAPHRRIWLGHELFNPRLIAEGELPWKGASPGDDDGMRRLRRTSPDSFFATLLRHADDQGARYGGFKLLYYHAVIDDRVIDMLLARRDCKVLHLVRRHGLERHASLVRANETDRWVTLRGERDAATPASGPVHLEVREMMTDLVRTDQFEDRFRAAFAGHDVLEIDYRELAEDLGAAMQRIGSWLSLDVDGLQVANRKTGPRRVRDGVENWDEVSAALRGTRWEERSES